jgi:predicted nuclease of predicted toxin-antitoxin system
LKFLLDENVRKTLAAILAANGHDIVRVAEVASGKSDVQVLTLARIEGRVLITYDSDFGELIFVGNEPPPYSIIYIKIDPSDQKSAALQLISLCKKQYLSGYFIVLDYQNIRMRAFPSEKQKND